MHDFQVDKIFLLSLDCTGTSSSSILSQDGLEDCVRNKEKRNFRAELPEICSALDRKEMDVSVMITWLSTDFSDQIPRTLRECTEQHASCGQYLPDLPSNSKPLQPVTCRKRKGKLCMSMKSNAPLLPDRQKWLTVGCHCLFE